MATYFEQQGPQMTALVETCLVQSEKLILSVNKLVQTSK